MVPLFAIKKGCLNSRQPFLLYFTRPLSLVCGNDLVNIIFLVVIDLQHIYF